MQKHTDLILLGLGGVGRALVRQVLANQEFHQKRYDLHLNFTVLADSLGFLADPSGLDIELIQGLLRCKEEGTGLSAVPSGKAYLNPEQIVRNHCRSGTVVVDCTATDQVIAALKTALSLGGKIALANKKPLAADWESYRELTHNPGVCRWESTVGSGLPVIASLNRIVASGDSVKRISGSLSGTLGLVMTEVQRGRPFSAVVMDAFEAGYTEPDPRDDLGGVDVARKALILARGMGNRLELLEVALTPLYPSDWEKLTVPEFLNRLPELDGEFRTRAQQASDSGKVLRYTADIKDGHCVVGLSEVPLDSPLGKLRGNDNLIEVYSKNYEATPLVIQGRGAGVDATAAGVLSDIVELSYTESSDGNQA